MCKIFEQNIYRPSADVSTSHIWIKPEEILLSSGPFDSSARNQIKGSVVEIDPLNSMLAVHIVAGKLPLTALITYASYQKLNIEVGTELFATFKSSAIHCFWSTFICNRVLPIIQAKLHVKSPQSGLFLNSSRPCRFATASKGLIVRH